jgi:hypothetical protein
VVLFSLFFFDCINKTFFSLSRFTFIYFFIFPTLISLFLLFSVSPLLADVVCGHCAFIVFTGEDIEIPSLEFL